MNPVASLQRGARRASPESARQRHVPRAALAPPPAAAAPAAPAAWRAEPDIQHLLDGLVGFYPREADALVAVQQLGTVHGLESSQLVLLGPADAGWLRFTWRARQWNQRPSGSQGRRLGLLSLIGLLGGLLGLMTAITWLDFDGFLGLELGLLAAVAAALFGAATSAALVALLHSQQPQFIDFDRTVRHKLAHGAWAVLVHDLSWAQQTGAVALIRHQAGHWCAVSSARS
jgi:hypothetical protein